MNGIGWAVKQMQDGQRVARQGWHGKGMWLALVNPAGPIVGVMNERVGLPEGHNRSACLRPFVVMFTASGELSGELVPWLCSQTDLLATDWEVAPAAERRHSPLWENARTGAGQEAKMAAQTTEG